MGKGKASQYKNQILGTLSCNLMSLSHGIVIAWMSPAILYLRSEKSPFKVLSISSEEVSWMASFFLIGTVFLGSLLCGILISFFGRKNVLWFTGVPHVGFWLLVLFGNNVYYLYVARILTGFAAGGIMITISANVTELSSKEIRPNLGCCFGMGVCLGRVIGSSIMSYTSYNINPYIFIGVPILFMILMIPFPETPHQLLRKGNDEKAKESLRFYRNLKKNEVNNEFEIQFEELKNRIMDTGAMEKLKVSDFKFKEIFQAAAVIFVNMSCGSLIIFNTVGSLYEKLHGDPHIGSIVYSVMQLAGAISAALFSNRFTRRKCFIVSSSIPGVSFIVTGVLSIYVNSVEFLRTHNWIFFIFINASIFSLQFGVNTLSHVVAAELFPLKTKSLSLAIAYSVASTLTFGVTTAFPLLLFEHGIYGIFYALLMCACICLFGTIFFATMLTETSKKNI